MLQTTWFSKQQSLNEKVPSQKLPTLQAYVCSFLRWFAGLTRLSPVPSPGTHTRDRVGKREGPVNREEASVESIKRELNSRLFFTAHFHEDAAKRPVFGEEARSQQIAPKTLSKRLGLGAELVTCITRSVGIVLCSSGGGGGAQLIHGRGRANDRKQHFFGAFCVPTRFCDAGKQRQNKGFCTRSGAENETRAKKSDLGRRDF